MIKMFDETEMEERFEEYKRKTTDKDLKEAVTGKILQK